MVEIQYIPQIMHMESCKIAHEVPDGRLFLNSVRDSRLIIGSPQIAPSSLSSSSNSDPSNTSLLRSLVLHLCCPSYRQRYRISPLPLSTSEVTMLPPASNPLKKTLLLDLDETLVHVTQDPTEKYTFSLVLDISGKPTPFYISTRPYLHQFLLEASQSFELVLFTAAEKIYADPIVSAIDSKGLITHRLYREHCMQWRGRLVKDLSCLGRSLRKVVIIDVSNRQDSEENFKFQPTNGVKIAKFSGDLRDTALLDLLQLLEKIKGAADVRGVVENLIKVNKRSSIY